jgi:hypothetical protein
MIDIPNSRRSPMEHERDMPDAQTDAPERIWAVTEADNMSAQTLGDVYAQQLPDGMVGAPVEYIRADILSDWRASQGYRYIGKDGKSVLARDLEDALDAAQAEIAKLRKQVEDIEGIQR